MIRTLLFTLSLLPSVAMAVTIVTAKEIVTLDQHNSTASAIAIEGDRFVAIGDKAALMRRFPKAAVDEQFSNSVIVPGLINQHDHPLLAALMLDTEVIAIEDWEMPEQSYPAAVSPDQYRARLSAALKHHSGGVFVTWGYHRLWHGEMSRQLLDKLAHDIPVVVWQRSGHEFFFNSLAMQQFGINAQTVSFLPKEATAQIDLDRGHVWEQGALAILPKLLPVLANPARYAPALERIKQYWHRAGVTHVVEPGGLTFPWLMETQMQVLGQRGTPFRMDYILDAKILAQKNAMETIASAGDALVSEWGSENSRYYPKQVKMFSDGAIFSQLMQMRDGYTDGHHGEWLTDPQKFKAMFETFWEAGYQIHIHQNGDQGLEFVLDVVADNMRRMPRKDHRTTIVHFGFSTPEQVKQIADLGVIVSANPYYPVALGEKYGEHGIGPERSQQMVRLGDLQKADVSFSLHSDMPMAPGKPLFLMWCAVNRLDTAGNVIGPEQRISPLQALRAVTIDAAYSLQREADMGTIEVGKLANLTILSDNPLTVDPLTIKDIEVVATVHEGTVYPLP